MGAQYVLFFTVSMFDFLIYDHSDWPGYTSPAEFQKTDESEAFRESVKALDKNSTPSSWFMPFKSADLIRPALTAPLCQLVSADYIPLPSSC